MENTQESIFAKVIPFLDDYMLCKMKLQQMKMKRNYNPDKEYEIKKELTKAKQNIESIVIK